MKPHLTIILLFLVGAVNCHFVYAQGDVNLWFYDPCKDEVRRVDFSLESVTRLIYSDDSNGEGTNEVLTIGPYKRIRSSKKDFQVRNVKPGTYVVNAYLGRGANNLLVEDFFVIDVGEKDYSDTLKMSKILRVAIAQNSSVLYMHCDELCNGQEEERDQYGVLKLNGVFENGIGREVNYYDKDGKLSERYKYELGDATYMRMETYNKGELIEFRIHQRINKKKVMEYVYNADSTLSFSFDIKISKKKGY